MLRLATDHLDLAGAAPAPRPRGHASGFDGVNDAWDRLSMRVCIARTTGAKAMSDRRDPCQKSPSATQSDEASPMSALLQLQNLSRVIRPSDAVASIADFVQQMQ